MSESATAKSGECSTGGCACAASAKAEPSATSSVKPKVTIQNGKGSAPRNMGPKFVENFGKIRWGSQRRPRREGHREVKVYG